MKQKTQISVIAAFMPTKIRLMCLVAMTRLLVFVKLILMQTIRLMMVANASERKFALKPKLVCLD